MNVEEEILEQHFEACALEYMADINGDGVWYTSAGVWEVQEERPGFVSFPLLMRRKDDGLAIRIDVDVTVWQEGIPFTQTRKP